MKIIITGGLGHIGSKLIRKIPKEFNKFEIIIIDNLLTQRYASLFDLPKNYKFKFINSDIKDPKIEKYFKNAKYLIHLSAITDATSSFERKKEVENNNYNSTSIIANYCIKYKINLIYISSTSVYGEQLKEVDETLALNKLLPKSPYAKTKIKEERLLFKLSKKYKLNHCILRFGTIFGFSIGMRFHTAVNKFIWQAVMGNKITVWKTALHQKRPYLDLDDAIDSIFFVIINNLFNSEIYNILTNNYTVNDIIKAIKNHVNNVSITKVSHIIMNQYSYNVSNRKISKLGFKFKGSLKKQLSTTHKKLKNTNIKTQ